MKIKTGVKCPCCGEWAIVSIFEGMSFWKMKSLTCCYFLLDNVKKMVV